MSDVPYSLLAELAQVKHLEHPPIHLWNPDNVKDIDIVVRRDGTWLHEGTPITRQRLVRLFSTVLRREDDDEYYLVTPVEKCRIEVEDAPFQAVLLEVTGEGEKQVLRFTTNVADEVVAGEKHPLRLVIDPKSGEPSPYLLVRDRLEALISRNVYYQLADLMVPALVDGERWLGVWSEGRFFKFMQADRLD